ncbi:MAG: aminoglycoside phosphotransferase family protein [Holosporales bacterium]
MIHTTEVSMHVLVPPALQETLLQLHGHRGEQWIAALPDLLERLGMEFHLQDLKPHGQLSFNLVLSGTCDHQPIILKLAVDEKSLAQEVAALQHFSGFGAAQVLHHGPGWALVERIQPGTSLSHSTALDATQKIHLSCQVMQTLHQAPPLHSKAFPQIEEWLQIFDHSWDLPENLLTHARRLRDQHLSSSQAAVLLHGDLHHGNILAHGKEWKVIDPQGVMGPKIAECWAFIMDIEKDTQLVADFFHWSLQEVRDWYFIQVMRTLCHCLENQVDPYLFKDLAQQAYSLRSPMF